MQDLKDYLKGKNKGDFARSVEIVPAYLSQILSGKKRPSFDLMLRIEKETKGAVSVSAWAPDSAA
ncbi:hypothetical protein JANAI62_03910 [Jannaschia pagri]|uniref:Helix-turn-helix n=1 Tax=Jannaschia pagri TaxID=2829797 RepID=A0ABQ4NH71_9RHOB|nr:MULTISPECIES: helix-turn-helix transcriptional regulator [unclassified Jannaschia]GIT90126.1 hypothetical protein JANAI61_05840 [Jannaschia sp. AI_61]GIT93768.1 hypothetical protein JANAI62_03910 [Jannaschia sp. AI_62]